MSMVYRIQDREGRGPFKPGVTVKWKSRLGLDMEPIWNELGISAFDIVSKIPQGMHSGCGRESIEQLALWFNTTERKTLHSLGYGLIVFEPTQILLRSPTQVLFAHLLPLSTL